MISEQTANITSRLWGKMLELNDSATIMNGEVRFSRDYVEALEQMASTGWSIANYTMSLTYGEDYVAVLLQKNAMYAIKEKSAALGHKDYILFFGRIVDDLVKHEDQNPMLETTLFHLKKGLHEYTEWFTNRGGTLN